MSLQDAGIRTRNADPDIKIISAAVAVAPHERMAYVAAPAATSYDITLPSPSECAGMMYFFYCLSTAGAGYVRVVRDTFVAANQLAHVGDRVVVVSDGAYWYDVGPNLSDLFGAVDPVVRVKSITLTAGGAEDEVISTSWPVKSRIVGCRLIARDANAANVTLKHGVAASEAAFTGATAKGTTDAATVQPTLLAAKMEIAKGASVIASFGAAGAVEVIIEYIPIP